MTEISCYYTLSSPWAYFGGPRAQEIAQRHGAKLILKPFDFQDVVPRTGGIPLRTRPGPRRTYHALELDRWRKHLGMPLNLEPRYYPKDGLPQGWNKPAGWMVIAAQERALDAPPPLPRHPARPLGRRPRHRRPAGPHRHCE
jgi:2-hydroxychromene-2-carboxylate isomerase